MFEVLHENDRQIVSESSVRLSDSTVRQLSESVRNSVRSGVWNVRHLEKTEKKRYVSKILGIPTIAVVVSALVSTLLHADAKIQATLYLSFVGMFIMIDSLEMFYRWLATQTRALIFCDCVLLISCIWTTNNTYYLIVGLMIVSGGIISYILNSRWLSAYNWKLTETVEKASNTNLDNKSTGAWQGHGRRESRTLLHQLGYTPDDNVLDLYIKPIYLLGHMHGMKKVNQPTDKNIERQYKELQSKYESLQQTSLDDYNSLIDEYNEIAIAYQDVADELEQWKTLYYQLQQESYNSDDTEYIQENIVELKKALKEEQPIDESVVDTGSLVPEEKAVRMLKDGISIRKVVEATGLSKYNVERLKKEVSA
ncbi:hypothetical protein P261_00516 [Lachnospiraceae bacterium TWA4]|nr:hypothetical protein P261_00516 [Lachnospiraceae bacterium TWA4]